MWLHIHKYSLVISSLLITVSLCLIYFSIHPVPTLSFSIYPEVNYLAGKNLDFDQLKSYFKQLSDKKGPVYALKIMNEAPMPQGTDMHLLAHTVADELYKKEGISGMKHCTDDFRNACSHSIVINHFYDKGENAIADINQACKEAPGIGGYDMCYHGLGHGVFAFANYEFPKTDELCKKIASGLKGDEYTECMGGATMEMISGGDHDKQTWQTKRQLLLTRDRPLDPCMSDLITEPGARRICLIYLTPHLWDLAGRNTAEIPDHILKASFEFCNAIPESDPQNRQACFGGFGKEFLAMAKGKDVRHIDKLTDLEMQKIYHWCLLTPYPDGQEACVLYAQGSMYWSGANDKSLPIRFCSLAPNDSLKNSCFKGLTKSVQKGDIKDKKYRQEFCNQIPSDLIDYCRTNLLNEN